MNRCKGRRSVMIARQLLESFPTWMGEYASRAGMIAQRDNDAHGGAWDDEITGALRYSPIHHLNTTTRKARSARTFGCKPHSDKDAGAHPLVGADTDTRALGL